MGERPECAGSKVLPALVPGAPRCDDRRVRRVLSVLFGAAALVISACGTGARIEPTPRASATPTAPASIAPTAAPTATPAASLIDHAVVYFARDRLPPVAAHVDGAGTGATAEARILSRMTALFGAEATRPLFNTAPAAKARPASVRVAGDLATVDFAVPLGDWGTAGSAGTRAFIQQLVYTASEEPGIRRVLITENGQPAIIGGEGVVIDHPATREDVAGYAARASKEPMTFRTEPRSQPIPIVSRLGVDSVAPSLVRFVVDTGLSGADAKAAIGFTASVVQNDEAAFPDLGKWVMALAVPDARTSDEAMRAFERTPVRSVRATTSSEGVRYEIGLDDLRPWRIAMQYEPLRIVLDIGGDPDAVSPNIALYTPAFGATVAAGDPVSGFIRAFEARFEYRITDARGLVVDEFASASLGTSELWGGFSVRVPSGLRGAATIEILLRSPKDGAVSESVFTSVQTSP